MELAGHEAKADLLKPYPEVISAWPHTITGMLLGVQGPAASPAGSGRDEGLPSPAR